MTPSGTFHWFELVTHDVDAAKSFYQSVLGWQSEKADSGHSPYCLFTKNGVPVAGVTGVETMLDWPKLDTFPRWIGYVSVDDVDSCVSNAVASGGRVLKEPFDVPSIGRIAWIEDPHRGDIGVIKLAA
ncbi:hypothetical protein JM93_01857 [Roseibium hamelinense]|uniref:VOC domain-containing protein n=1 Tax=Roseibium hamelinense TaxID=150831 RepID=A0A562T7N7_9HYPH|nr:VOC family protein [Roseibium hamelinense]MTI43555.1 VOC family protein [Roseibium hamelinense]TWI89651.1 hypothetical protein JM93_01857 [Roseibium hamelinense]